MVSMIACSRHSRFESGLMWKPIANRYNCEDGEEHDLCSDCVSAMEKERVNPFSSPCIACRILSDAKVSNVWTEYHRS